MGRLESRMPDRFPAEGQGCHAIRGQFDAPPWFDREAVKR
jgi:hypothetical protein